MDPADEQQQEVEVLLLIYPDELTVLSDSHFTIRVNLDTVAERKHALLLDVKYPETYPEVVPELRLEVAEDLDDEDGYEDDSEDDEEVIASRRAVNLAETVEFEKDDIRRLLVKLEEEAEMNLGMPSIFALVTQLKEEAEQAFEKKVHQTQQAHDREVAKREKEEQKKFNGTKVTKESFAEWRNKFREEMEVEKKDREAYENLHRGRMTGREIFEKGLAGEEEEE